MSRNRKVSNQIYIPNQKRADWIDKQNFDFESSSKFQKLQEKLKRKKQ